jgi:hypothetical protein
MNATEYLTGYCWPSIRSLAIIATLPLAIGACESNDVQEAGTRNPVRDAVTFAADENDPRAGGVQKEATGSTVSYKFGSSASESAACLERLQERITSAAAAQKADSTARRPDSGRDPVFAEKNGWYAEMPEFMDGSILPCSRIVAYYGHPSSKRMGALGEYPKEEMLRRFKNQVAEWEKADPATPVVPALHMVSVVAQGDPGTSGKYRTITSDEKVKEVYGWAKEAGGIFIVDLQVGQDDVRNILPRFDWILKNPDVHLAVDPEFYMRGGAKPGAKIGTMHASDINYVSEHLAKLVREHDLPPKVLIIHRFTRPMVKDYRDIKIRPEVNLVMHMDGWGAPWLKFDSYHDYIVDEPVQFTGWKNFYHNDTKKGDPLVTPRQLLKAHPTPLYIQYQ